MNDNQANATSKSLNRVSFRQVGHTIINADRLLVAGFITDEDRESGNATLRFDNGSQVCLHLDAEASLNELL
jgi:hypothetical protein